MIPVSERFKYFQETTLFPLPNGKLAAVTAIKNGDLHKEQIYHRILPSDLSSSFSFSLSFSLYVPWLLPALLSLALLQPLNYFSNISTFMPGIEGSFTLCYVLR